MSGFLDNILNIFEQHHHHFILVGMYGMLWDGVDVPRYRRDSIEVLIDSSRTMISLAESLLQTGDWVSSTSSNSSLDQELKLESAGAGFGPAQNLKSFHFYTEHFYHLSVQSCLADGLKVPDLSAKIGVTLEEEYVRDPHRRFGPMTWEIAKVEAEENDFNVLWDIRARSPDNTIPIYVPSISTHINAMLYHAQHTSPKLYMAHYLGSFVTDLYLDWPPTRKWFLDTKVADSNKARMEVALGQPRSTYHDLVDTVLDTFVSEKLPWELTIPREGKESVCDERCEYCQSKGA